MSHVIQIKDVLLVVSLLGIIQGFVITAMILVRSGKRPNREWLLSGLFLASMLVMVLVTSVNSGWMEEQRWMTIIEVFITLLIGPMLFWYIRLTFLKKPVSRLIMGLHFLPAMLWIGLTLLEASTGSGLIHLPFYVFIVHFQTYILVSTVSYFYRKRVGERIKQKGWMELLLYFFLFLCVGQWLRFAFLPWEALQLIVPSAAACSFYLITIIGLQRSSLWPSHTNRPKHISTIILQDSPPQLQALEKLMLEEECYRNPQLNRNKLAWALDISPNHLTQLIQHAYAMGFTDYINHLRLQKVKQLLVDPSRQHLTLEAIGQEAGFQSRSAFYRVFKAETGRTPAAYRKEKTRD